MNVKPRTRIGIKSELHRPLIKGTKLLIVTLKKINHHHYVKHLTPRTWNCQVFNICPFVNKGFLMQWNSAEYGPKFWQTRCLIHHNISFFKKSLPRPFAALRGVSLRWTNPSVQVPTPLDTIVGGSWAVSNIAAVGHGREPEVSIRDCTGIPNNCVRGRPKLSALNAKEKVWLIDVAFIHGLWYQNVKESRI